MTDYHTIAPVIIQINLPDKVVIDMIHNLFNDAIGRCQNRFIKSEILFQPVAFARKCIALLVGDLKVPSVFPVCLMCMLSIMCLCDFPGPEERQGNRKPGSCPEPSFVIQLGVKIFLRRKLLESNDLRLVVRAFTEFEDVEEYQYHNIKWQGKDR